MTDIKTARFSWDTILDFSVSTVQDIAMQTAPVIWMFLTSIVLGGDWVIAFKVVKAGDKEKGKGSNHVHNPYLVRVQIH